ncbi:hypothetical protein K432DRAFT_309239, partial [Lepidopterella palustris CBS 459.81]
ILEAQSAILTNHEVLAHLEEQEAEYGGTDNTGRTRPKPDGLKAVLRDAKIYLTRPPPPSTPLTATALSQNRTLVALLSPTYTLTKAEYLMLYNLYPKTLVELEVIIEEGSARFSEEEQLDILRIVADVLGGVEGMEG